MYASPCSEFPNDNPELHSGAILVVEQVCGAPVLRMIGVNMEAGWAALGREIEEIEPSVLVQPEEHGVDQLPPVAVLQAAEEVVEIVAARAEEPAAEEVEEPAPKEVEEPAAETRPSGIYLSSDEELGDDDIVITPLEPLMEAEIFACDQNPVAQEVAAAAVVEACAFSELVEIMATVAEHEEPGAGTWVSTLVGEGAAPRLPSERVTSLVAGGILLADGSVGPRFDGARVAWRAILRSESEDFGACGALALDEWAADLIARLLGSASRAASMKRQLRDHGVAAFGLALHAA
jgi:hypothetical protein